MRRGQLQLWSAPRAARPGMLAHVGRDLSGVVVVLDYSRAFFAESLDYHNTTSEALGRALVHAVQYFGGAPRRWLFEDADCLVWDGQAFTAPLLALAERTGSTLQVASPNHRGPAERVLGDLRMRWLQAPVRILAERALRRPHPRHHKRSIAALFAEERKHLLPAPSGLAALLGDEGGP